MVHGNAQDCVLTVKGNIYDEVSNTPLAYANVFIQEISKGTTTDDTGDFRIQNICPGEYHLIFSHIGCEEQMIHLDLIGDTTLTLTLHHTPTSLGTVEIEGKKNNFGTESSISVNRQFIEDNSNQNLSGLLENESGVHLIKNGSGIAKPVVHGLYGNRLTILNNGVVQSGQQWGNDHSPEIDPNAADNIVVLKGVSAIEFGGSNLGSVILVEPKRIEKEPHLHGQIKYAFESNGRGHTINTRLGKYSDQLAWRVNGTFKKSGDKKAPSYFLRNTGVREASLSLQLEKTWNEKLFWEFYASSFNTSLGILRGSHIGNLTDLEDALARDIPFFTEPNYIDSIAAPRQEVSHHLIKSKLKYFISENQFIELLLASQINDRKEFDIRRSGRSDIPALSLTQISLNAELKYTKDFGSDWSLKVGNQNIITDNTNNPETGILPLIPDYISWKSGLFSTLSKRYSNLHFKLGLRYDYEYQNAITISNSIPKEIVRFENNFHTFNGIFSLKYDFLNTHSFSLNTGLATRNPAINELYSSGLHQGVSGIEEGDANLETEKALKNTLEYKWFPSPNFSLTTLLYHQQINDFIFLNPQDEIRLTIRGAFPVFRYEQTDASIYGLDVAAQFTLQNTLIGKLRYSYLKGNDRKNNEPLVFMPPNSFYSSLSYRLLKTKQFTTNLLIEDAELEINNRYVFEQSNLLEEQDFVAPPPSYNILGLKLSANIRFSTYKLRCFIRVDNLLNTSYRDYLNRQRYFADENGINITIGANYKF